MFEKCALLRRNIPIEQCLFGLIKATEQAGKTPHFYRPSSQMLSSISFDMQ